MRIRTMPIAESRLRSIAVVIRMTAAPIMNNMGTTGYPNVRYGRSKSGRFFRSTSTDAAVIP